MAFGLSATFGTGSLHEVAHQRRYRGRMRLEQQVTGIHDMGFHSRQRVHPRQHLGEIEVDVVPTPDHQRGRLPGLEILRDRIEASRIVGVVHD